MPFCTTAPLMEHTRLVAARLDGLYSYFFDRLLARIDERDFKLRA